MEASTVPLVCLMAIAFCFVLISGQDSGDVAMLPLPEQVSFLLYTMKNPTKAQQLRTNDFLSVALSNFNKSVPTRITIHGWMSDSQQDINTRLRDAYLSQGPNNIIAINWVEESVNVYELSVKHVPGVGLKIGEFIDWMVKNGFINLQKLTLLGHSLGSHIAGIAARSVKSGKVQAIYGLDPAQPEFGYNTSTIRLRASDAYYVESIQTTSGTLGYREPIGKASFYPNGGVYQPGCFLDLGAACSHFRAYIYMAEAIRSGGFPSKACISYKDALNNNCGNTFSQTIRMGDPANADIASGVFYVPVHAFPPYSYSG